MFTSPKRYLNLTKSLSVSEFKLRDQGTVLGFLWTLLYPLSMFLVLYVIFSKWMGTHVENFPSYLLVGIVLWNFFTTSTTNALDIITRKAQLVKNLNFPKTILVISSVLSIFMSFLLEFGILLIFLVFLGIRYTPAILYFPVIIIIELTFALAVSFFLASFHVYYRDIKRIWAILVMLGFFLTPIFYPLSIISQAKQKIMLLNPMLHIITSARDCLLYQKQPPIVSLCIVLLAGIVLLGLGYFVFRKMEDKFAEIV